MISSPLILSQQSCDVETLVKPYSDQLSSLIDKDAPLRTKSIVLRHARGTLKNCMRQST